jgi:hypothetical protein
MVNATLVGGSSGKPVALLKISYFTEEFAICNIYNIILDLGKTTNSQDRFPAIHRGLLNVPKFFLLYSTNTFPKKYRESYKINKKILFIKFLGMFAVVSAEMLARKVAVLPEIYSGSCGSLSVKII